MQLRIGVTGHRILTGIDRIREGIDLALHQIRSSFPSGTFTVLSGLAEGADSLVAEQAIIGFHARLIAVLPFPRNEYMQDFTEKQVRAHFLSLLEKADEIVEIPPASTRDECYLAAGHYVLDHCDVLLAIWDGTSAQGKGGTGDIVTEARRRRIAIAWIRAGNRLPGTREPTYHPDQGKVTFENFPITTVREV